MTKEKMESYKNKLRHERLIIAKEISDFEKPVNLGDDIDHFDEKTDEVVELSNRFGEENDLKRRMDEIDIALGKIEKGDYGTCESCGAKIEDEVLDIDPESRLCEQCKAKG